MQMIVLVELQIYLTNFQNHIQAHLLILTEIADLISC